ncbi:MAG: hypothetical protein ACRDZ4_20990 [Egibacteraceae bacterium]
MKRRRSTVCGGRKRAFRSDASYRLHLRSLAEEIDPTKRSSVAALYYGSRCDKAADERRPRKGGKVHS